MAGSSSDLDKLHEIDLMCLAPAQLTQLKGSVEQELNVFEESLETLKIAQTKLSDSKKCLQKLMSEKDGSDILVPLSASMYVPGKVADANHVMIDVGTGYYIKMSLEKGTDYFQRKVDFITEQIEKIQGIGREKYKVRDAIQEVLEIKVRQLNSARKLAAES